MSRFTDFFRRLFSAPKVTPAQIYIRALPSGRASLDNADSFLSRVWTFAPPSDFDANWQLLQLDIRNLDRMTPARLMELLADFSPEVSRALWDFLRLCNPGFETKALRPGTDTQDETAQQATDAFIAALADQYGTFDIVVGRLFMGPPLRGAFCAELVLDRRGRLPLDIATPDPAGIRFRKRIDPDRGEVWEPGQWQNGQWVSLAIPTFRYIPVDPMPNTPYGRPLYAPALFVAIFLLGTLHDLKRVIQQQGYPRLDLSVAVPEAFTKNPGSISPESLQTFMQNLVDRVSAAYAQLDPDDAYIHTDNVTVNRPVGAVDANSLAGIDAVIAFLERMAVRALKTMPLMLSIPESSTEAEANRQFEIFAASIKSIQHYCETLLERLFTLALEAQGIQAQVKFRFAEMRAAEMLRDAQTEQTLIANAARLRDEGWITQDEASMRVTGKPAAAPGPVRQTAGSEPGQGSNDGQEDLNQDDRAGWIALVRSARDEVANALGRFNGNGHH